MHYAGIKYTDIADGTGVRVSLFVSGCRNHCKGCFNQQAWDFHYGKEFTMQTADDILSRVSKPFIRGISILGGDPFEPQNIRDVTWLLYTIKKLYPEKDVWVYTGYLFDDFKGHEIMQYIDVLVDGPFVLEERDITLQFRGSRNQRLINVRQSLETGGVVLCT